MTDLLVAEVLPTAAVSERTGLSPRQLLYWKRIGLLVPSVCRGDGQGRRQGYSHDDLRLALLLAEVTKMHKTWGGNRCHKAERVRWLLAGAYRQDPNAPYYVILDAEVAMPCNNAIDIVEASDVATVTTVICAASIINQPAIPSIL